MDHSSILNKTENCFHPLRMALMLMQPSKWQRDFNIGILISINAKYYLQGVRGQSGFFKWALRERNIQVRLYLKVVLKSWDVDILIIRTNFQKYNLGWPPQPPRENVPKINKIVGLWWSIPHWEPRIGNFGAMI